MPDLTAFTALQLGFLAASAFIAGLARGFSGFGAALIFVPLASTVVGPMVAAPLLLVTALVLAAGLIPNAWRIANRREVGTMLIGTLVGVPIGAMILARAEPIAIRWTIAIAVTIQPREKTMTDAEIDALAAKIVAEVSKRTKGVLRA